MKFGIDGLSLMPEIYKIEDRDVLKTIREGIRAAGSVAELRSLYRLV